jgi:hypothetical protein
MKTIVLIPFYFASVFLFAQHGTDKLVAELSPLNASFNYGISYNVQGKLSYTFTDRLSVSLSHNEEVYHGLESAIEKLSRKQLRRSSLTDLSLGITLFNSQKPRIDPTEEIQPKNWVNKLFRLDMGLVYYKFANKRPDYYTYDVDEQGNYKIINSINRLSASLGFSFIIRENNIKDPDNMKLKRQHTLSAGAYYGINYDLQGIVKMEGKNPSERAPKEYAFTRSGFYLRYNFRQQLGKHLFLGMDLLFAKMPRVEYTRNPAIPFFFRGGESESGIQPYAGIIVGWHFN